MFCPKCGKEIAGGGKFCTGCGFSVGGPAAQAGRQAAGKPPQQQLPLDAIQQSNRSAQHVRQGPTRQEQPSSLKHQSRPHPPQQLQQRRPTQATSKTPVREVVPDSRPAARTSQTSGLDFRIPPPPGQPGQENHQNTQTHPDGLPPGEFTPYSRTQNQSSFTISYEPKSLAIFGVAMLMLMIVGIPAVQYIASGTSGFPIQGHIESRKNNFSLYIPEGWSSVKDPRRKTGHRDAAAYYFKGRSRNPDIVSIIYSMPNNSSFPKFLSQQDLQALEPFLLQMNKQYMQALGMSYELLELKTYMIDGDHAVWMDGNAMKRGKANKRDFTFLAFRSSRLYIVKFMFDEIRVEEFWPEIKGILDSMVFL